MKALEVKITTQSNLYIGGMPQGFEIGGIDMQTAAQGNKPNEKPYIPASSFKGALRDICNDHYDERIAALYKDYEVPEKIKHNMKKHMFIFGIPGVNRSPKMLITDFVLPPNAKNCFSIDTKNSIEKNGDNLSSNPRTYRVARSGLIFQGKLLLHFDLLGETAEKTIEEYLIKMCAKFNEGIYRIGNSKSRGYGLIAVEITG